MSKQPTAENLPTHIEMPPLPEEPAPTPVPAPRQEVEEPEEEQREERAVQEPAEETEDEHEAKRLRAIKDRVGRAERLERERDELARRLATYEAKQQDNKPEAEEDDDFTIAPDDLAEGKHLKKVASKIHKLEQRLQQYQQQSEMTSIETRLKAQYADFDAIVSQDNIETLRLAYPEIASTINSSPDLYSKAVSAYTIIKKLGIAQEDTFLADRQRAQINATKPKSVASVSPQRGDSPLSTANAFANGLTEDLKKQLVKEMLEARKNR